jgi:hypothetical protein
LARESVVAITEVFDLIGRGDERERFGLSLFIRQIGTVRANSRRRDTPFTATAPN